MTNTARRLLHKPLPLAAPGVRSATAHLRRRGYKISYYVCWREDGFQYLVKVERSRNEH
jgi:hypothetical protein